MRRWIARVLAALLLPGLAWSGVQAHGWIRAHATPQLQVPAGWPAPRYDAAQNPITRAGFELGRRLFYDPLLSRDGSVSCGSCHQQFAAFAHFDHRVSHGVGGRDGKRNAPGLFNLAWQPEFMWDGAVHHLELQPLAPLQNPLEMDERIEAVLERLRRHAEYPLRFERAFGSPGIDTQRFLRALTQFTATLVSADSAYDRHLAGAPYGAAETRGLASFRARCAGCHAEPLFSDYRYRNNGLDEQPADPGRAAISGDARDHGRFRVPSLRNVALTAPYMHDGRFDTLDQVLQHYAHGLQRGAALDPLLAAAPPLAEAEAADLRAFLETLTDERFVHDPRFAEAAAR